MVLELSLLGQAGSSTFKSANLVLQFLFLGQTYPYAERSVPYWYETNAKCISALAPSSLLNFHNTRNCFVSDLMKLLERMLIILKKYGDRL